MVAFVVAVLLATYADEDSLARDDGWLFAAVAVVAYIVSRGLAKLATREPYDEDGRDRGRSSRPSRAGSRGRVSLAQGALRRGAGVVLTGESARWATPASSKMSGAQASQSAGRGHYRAPPVGRPCGVIEIHQERNIKNHNGCIDPIEG